ncbi:MAG: fumarate reductase subunit C [Acidobacteria bacterium]|nr:MAG: fumarate reductase subunit C [Acidobacteriota bacterium]
MRHNAVYTPYHPRWHRTRVSTYWWLGRWSYFLFILRELSSIFVAWVVIYLLVLVAAVSKSAVRYQQFLDWSRNPFMLSLNILSLLFIVLHAVTWFNLAPQAMVVHVGGRRLPGSLIAISNYAGLVAVSIVILGLLLIRW